MRAHAQPRACVRVRSCHVCTCAVPDLVDSCLLLSARPRFSSAIHTSVKMASHWHDTGYDRADVVSPWETAKAIAYHQVLQDVSEHVGVPAHELIGKRV